MALISARDYARKQQEGWNHVLLDVRIQDEWDEGHVAHAHLLPLHLLPVRIKEVVADPATPIAVYCRSGGRSGMAAQALASMGYQHVFDIEGGFGALQAAGL